MLLINAAIIHFNLSCFLIGCILWILFKNCFLILKIQSYPAMFSFKHFKILFYLLSLPSLSNLFLCIRKRSHFHFFPNPVIPAALTVVSIIFPLICHGFSAIYQMLFVLLHWLFFLSLHQYSSISIL